MSTFVKSVPVTERILSLNEHKQILRKLMKGTNTKECLKYLHTYQMDESLEECDQIVRVLITYCNRSPIGRIAEFTLRQWINRNGKKVDPISHEYKRIIVKGGPPKRRSNKKSTCLRLEFQHWLVESRICIEPDLYEREKETEQFFELLQEEIIVPPVTNSEKTILKRKFEDDSDTCPILSKVDAL